MGRRSLIPVLVEKQACVNTLTLLYLGDGLLVAALLLAGLWSLSLVSRKDRHAGFAGRHIE